MNSSQASVNPRPQCGRTPCQGSRPTRCPTAAGPGGVSTRTRPALRLLAAHGNGGGSTTREPDKGIQKGVSRAASEGAATAGRREAAGEERESFLAATLLQGDNKAVDMPVENGVSGVCFETRRQRIVRRVQEAESRRIMAKQHALVRRQLRHTRTVVTFPMLALLRLIHLLVTQLSP